MQAAAASRVSCGLAASLARGPVGLCTSSCPCPPSSGSRAQGPRPGIYLLRAEVSALVWRKREARPGPLARVLSTSPVSCCSRGVGWEGELEGGGDSGHRDGAWAVGRLPLRGVSFLRWRWGRSLSQRLALAPGSLPVLETLCLGTCVLEREAELVGGDGGELWELPTQGGGVGPALEPVLTSGSESPPLRFGHLVLGSDLGECQVHSALFCLGMGRGFWWGQGDLGFHSAVLFHVAVPCGMPLSAGGAQPALCRPGQEPPVPSGLNAASSLSGAQALAAAGRPGRLQRLLCDLRQEAVPHPHGVRLLPEGTSVPVALQPAWAPLAALEFKLCMLPCLLLFSKTSNMLSHWIDSSV